MPALIREALIDLYLSVKIRKNTDLDKLNAEAYRAEKAKLKRHKHLDEATLVNYIQECISILMRMRLEEFMDHRKQVIAIDQEYQLVLQGDSKQSQEAMKLARDSKDSAEVTSSMQPKLFEAQMIKYEDKIRQKIKTEEQYKLYCQSQDEKYDKLLK